MLSRGRKIILFLAGFAGLAGGAGCLPGASGGGGAMGPAPVIDAAPPAGLAAYRRNRPEAPETFTVFPKPMRDNTFGEFNDDLHDSRGWQEALPALPGENGVMAMAAPGYGQGGYPLPPGEVMGTGAGRAQTGTAGRGTVRQAGLVGNDKHFYPLEQLVYGGEYPEADAPDQYRLMPRDEISVTVRDHPEFSGKVVIQADGTVRVPNAPDFIRLRGLTADEAADELRRVLGTYVRGDCEVRVQTNRARGGYYFVLGDVMQPGRFPMGLEEVKLSDAVLAANWEANPARLDADGDDLSPSFPAASPRGRFVAPPSADLARVVLITPHRSQPARSTHDIRSAMLGVTANDPVVRPGQIVVVPSLSVEKNRALGIGEVAGFSTGGSPARLPDAFPDNGAADYAPVNAPEPSAVERNMTSSFDANQNGPEEVLYYEETLNNGAAAGARVVSAQELSAQELPPWEEPSKWQDENPARWAGMSRASAARREIGQGTPVRRAPSTPRRGWGIFGFGRGAAQRSPEAAARAPAASTDGGWNKGF